jgi:glycine reductase
MRLQLERIDIKAFCAGSPTRVSDHVLYADFSELERVILKDDRIRTVRLTIASPGERIRIVNVVDVIQPRCKVGPEGWDFPGWLGKLRIAGDGRTRSLEGVSVVLSNRYSKRSYSALIDMFGTGAEMSRYGATTHLSIDPVPANGVGEREFERAVKLAGLKAAVYLARAAGQHPVDRTEVYELNLAERSGDSPSRLPRVAYYYQLYTPQHDYQGIPDPILYGSEVKGLLPTLVHPNEILDGAVTSGHTIRELDTYTIQNHPLVRELYRRHRKDLIFAGVVIGVASLEAVQRERMAMMAASLVSNALAADGVVLTKTHGGMPHVDLALVAEACEHAGVKTTLFIQLVHGVGSTADEASFSSDALDAIVNIGQTQERIRLSQAERILGGDPATPISNPDFLQKAGDDEIEIEGFLLAGVFDVLGGSRIMAVDY